MPKWLLEDLAQIQPWDLDMDLALAMEAMGLALVEWEAMGLALVEWEAMGLAMVEWVEAWEEAMAWTDAVRRSMLKVPQILT